VYQWEVRASETLGQFIAKRMPAPPTVLYHYTSPAGLMGIIRNREIWATKLHYLNDVSECGCALRITSQMLTEKEARETDGATRLALAQMKERLELLSGTRL
jgi:hypothetical protein